MRRMAHAVLRRHAHYDALIAHRTSAGADKLIDWRDCDVYFINKNESAKYGRNDLTNYLKLWVSIIKQKPFNMPYLFGMGIGRDRRAQGGQ